MVDSLKQKVSDDFREVSSVISFVKKILGNSSWCVCPQASHSDWSPGDGSEGLPEEGAEQGQLRIPAWAADPTGALSSRGQGRVNQGDKGKWWGNLELQRAGIWRGTGLLVAGGRTGGQREGALAVVPRMRRNLAKEFRLLTATPMGPV